MERSSQLLKGVLEMCLLAIIAEEPSYGYEMARKLESRGIHLVGDGTIYPLLSRLQRQDLVEAYTVESQGGPPRKYYKLASTGRERLDHWVGEWRNLSTGVNQVLTGGEHG